MKSHFLSAILSSGFGIDLGKNNPLSDANYFELAEEYEKIKNKKSNYSRKIREQIIYEYERRQKLKQNK